MPGTELCQERDVQILEFPTIITSLIAASDPHKNADSAAEHMIRRLRAYGFL